MPSVGMVGRNGQEMANAFLNMCQGAANCYHITETKPRISKPDILVISEASPVLSDIIPGITMDNYLVVNADDKQIFPYLSSKQAKLITYGFNNKACITASSVTDNGLQVCIQRAFMTIDGDMLDPQEFAIPNICITIPAEAALGAAAAWAICGKM